jgi:hypothetical protein
MANEIYNTTWWGNAIDTAITAGTEPDFFGSQMKMLTSQQPEEVINGDFSGSTGWSNAGTYNGNNYVEITDNGARLVTDGTGVGISQNVMVIGVKYKLTFDVTVATLGSAKFDGSGITFNSVGNHSITFTAYQTGLTYYRNSGAADITIDNVSLKIARAEEVEAVKCLADWIHTTALQDLNN